MKMTRDELEFTISQYLDGTLNAVQQAAIEEVLARDADARAIFAEYERLDSVVKSAMPLPEVAWDHLASRIRSATDACEAPVRHYRLPVGRWTKYAAVAAVVALAFGIVTQFRIPPGTSDMTPVGPVASNTAINSEPIEIEISAPPVLAEAPVTEIEVGRPPGLASVNYYAADSIVTRPSTIWIASGVSSAQDSDLLIQ